MKSGFKKALTVFCVIMAVGVLCVVAGVAMGGSVSYQISLPNKAVNVTKDYINNSVKFDAFTDITVYESYANIRIEYGEDYRVTYKYRTVDVPHIEVKHNHLFVNVDNSFESQASMFLDDTLTFFDFGNDEANEMVITVPVAAELSGICVSVDYGNAEAEGISAKHMQLDSYCGNVTVNGGEITGGLYCDAQNGNVAVSNLTCGSFCGIPYDSNMVVNSLDTGEMDIVEAHCANVELENCTVTDFEMITDSSNLTVNNMVCDAFDIASEYGNADVTRLKTKKLYVENKSGNMDFELICDKEEYGLDIMPINGNIEINGEEQPETVINTDSEYLLKVNSSYGNIDIDFINE